MEKGRRKFIVNSLFTASGLSLLPGLGLSNSRVSANDKVNMAVIGCNNKGFNVMREFLRTGRVNCLALCDIDTRVLERRRTEISDQFGQQPTLYGDFRKMLEDREIDAVIVGSPDHWHCLHTVYACEAGKDVYVEKPLANSIAECQVMVAAAEKYNRVIQVGQQQRSGDVWNGAMQYIKSGKLGVLRKVNLWANFAYGAGSPMKPDEPVPAGIDYAFWQGPAEHRTFNPTRFHGNWRHFWDYGGGLMTDWGVHLIDMALWAKDVVTPPITVLGYGENLGNLDFSRETFDTMAVTYPMDGYVINWQHLGGIQQGPYGMPYGVEFIGDRSTVVANREKWEVYLENKADKEAAEEEAAAYKLQSGMSEMEHHVRNFLDCIHSRNETNCPIHLGKNVALYAHMGNIAARSAAGMLSWDDSSGLFTNNSTANRFITPDYHNGWELPKI